MEIGGGEDTNTALLSIGVTLSLTHFSSRPTHNVSIYSLGSEPPTVVFGLEIHAANIFRMKIYLLCMGGSYSTDLKPCRFN